ncbi:zinc finger, CCHC-type containing protein, partial [Tanacetum coccineum]
PAYTPVCMQKLFFGEEELEDDFTLADYYIHNNPHSILCLDWIYISRPPPSDLSKHLDESRTLADYGGNKRYALYVVLDDNNRTIAD